MELMAMKCPNCSGEINYQPGMVNCKCPYCDSIVRISLSAQDASYEQQILDREAEKKARQEYLEKLRKWKNLVRIFMAADVICGVPLTLIDKDSVLFVPAALLMCFFMFAASPVVHKFAPIPPSNISASLNKKERPAGIGKLYGIFIGLYLAGGLVGSMFSNAINPDKPETDSTSSVAAASD